MRAAWLALSCTLLHGQEAAPPFQGESAHPWIPSGLFRVETEHFTLASGDIHRTRGRLHLKWSFDLGPLTLDVGSLHSLSDTANRQDLPRFENLRSNGSYLDLAALSWRPTTERGGAELSAGLVENPLLSGESLWDPNLRVMGGSGRLFWRSEQVAELGLRAVGGKVRLLDGGRVSMEAAQAVFRFDTGPFQWTLHGDRWRMEPRQEDAPDFLRQNPGAPLPGPYGGTGTAYLYSRFDYTVLGAGVAFQGLVPFEVKGQRQTHTEGRGEELQVWVGSPRRAWWPQAAWIRQRLDPMGALASVNGDHWWFHANADGNLFLLALNLPRRFRLEARHVDQTKRGAPRPVTRESLALLVRF